MIVHDIATLITSGAAVIGCLLFIGRMMQKLDMLKDTAAGLRGTLDRFGERIGTLEAKQALFATNRDLELCRRDEQLKVIQCLEKMDEKWDTVAGMINELSQKIKSIETELKVRDKFLIEEARNG